LLQLLIVRRLYIVIVASRIAYFRAVALPLLSSLVSPYIHTVALCLFVALDFRVAAARFLISLHAHIGIFLLLLSSIAFRLHIVAILLCSSVAFRLHIVAILLCSSVAFRLHVVVILLFLMFWITLHVRLPLALACDILARNLGVAFFVPLIVELVFHDNWPIISVSFSVNIVLAVTLILYRLFLFLFLFLFFFLLLLVVSPLGFVVRPVSFDRPLGRSAVV
jgi:hypothetical protein